MQTIQEVANWCRNWFMRIDDPFWVPYKPIIEIEGHYSIRFIEKEGIEEFVSRRIPFKFLLQLHQILDDGLNFDVIVGEGYWVLVFDYKRFAPDELYEM